ncbi:FKBP-type peptidyl-prolyl cis-trans isomerase [Saccharicrinis sp. FJH54]|uniref:FKBP-type peptidyl-prolyl cis-trans isomerase n=1 Tax=Saccharicrinis sp. FJH54 TaxID=3344665 RepID=UPI0035D50D89
MFRLIKYLPLFILVFSSCKNTPRKSIRENQLIEASKQQYMLEWNRRMTEQQDSLFKIIADSSVFSWTKADNGYYYTLQDSENGQVVTSGDVVTINLILNTILNEPVDSIVSTFVVGKSQDIPLGIQHAVLQMRKDQTGSFLFPFNLAYGVKGIPGKVVPFQPLRVKITIEKVEKR